MVRCGQNSDCEIWNSLWAPIGMAFFYAVFAHFRLFSRIHTTLGPSVRPSLTQCKNTPKGGLTCVTAPAHLHATDAVVYTALFASDLH